MVNKDYHLRSRIMSSAMRAWMVITRLIHAAAKALANRTTTIAKL